MESNELRAATSALAGYLFSEGTAVQSSYAKVSDTEMHVTYTVEWKHPFFPSWSTVATSTVREAFGIISAEVTFTHGGDRDPSTYTLGWANNRWSVVEADVEPEVEE